MSDEFINIITLQPAQIQHPSLYPHITSQQSPNIIMQSSPAFGPSPVVITCPSCNARVRTSVSNFCTSKTHLWCLCLFCCGFACGCCLIPYCMKSCQAQKHKCPRCNNNIGVYNN
ncbi:hypothetical protein ACKWTF_003403 [Chironomus riparius]